MRRTAWTFIAIGLLAATAAAGAAVRGWTGALLWPVLLCVTITLISVPLFILGVYASFRRRHSALSQAKQRLRALSTDELRGLIADPMQKDAALARVVLMERGVDARPPKEQLFAMLTSGNPTACAQAMVYMQVFYSEMFNRLPKGVSNLDPAETWQSRIAALRDAQPG
jgi:hypothetical protein